MILRKIRNEHHVIFESEEEFRTHFKDYAGYLLRWEDLPKSMSNRGRDGRQHKAQKWNMPILGPEQTIADKEGFDRQFRDNKKNGYVRDGRIYSIAVFYERFRLRFPDIPIKSIAGQWIVGNDGSVHQILSLKEMKHNSGKEHLNLVMLQTPMGYYPLYETTILNKMYKGTSFSPNPIPKITKRQKEFIFSLMLNRDLMFAFKKVYPYHYERFKGNINKIMLFLRKKVLTDLFMQELTQQLDRDDEIRQHLNDTKGSLKDMLDILVSLAQTGRDEKAKIMAAKEVIEFHRNTGKKAPQVTIYNNLSSPPSPSTIVDAEVVEDKKLEDKGSAAS